MSGRICRICSDVEMAKRAAQLIAQRLPDRAIAEQLGLTGHAGRMAVSRHRRNHIEKPAKAIAAAANKGRDLAERPREVIAAAEAGDPLEYLKVDRIVGDIKRVGERLEKNADEASQAGQRLAVAALSGQQLRQNEVRLKAAGVGGYAAVKTQVAIGIGTPAFKPFVIRMNIGDRAETYVMAPEGTPDFEVHDAETGQPFEHSGGTIVTRGEESKHDLLIVPRGYPTGGPVIEHAPIEQAPAARPAPDDSLAAEKTLD
jgi:hypothetical protein